MFRHCDTRFWWADEVLGFFRARFWLAADKNLVLGWIWVFSQCIKIGYSSAQCIKIGYSSAQCIKIGYSSAQCKKIGYMSVQCIKIGYSSVQRIKIEYSSAQCIKIWNRVISALCNNFRIFFRISGHLRPPGKIIPPPDKIYAAAG